MAKRRQGYPVAVEVPAGATARVQPPGQEPREVGSGKFDYTVSRVSWGDVGSNLKPRVVSV